MSSIGSAESYVELRGKVYIPKEKYDMRLQEKGVTPTKAEQYVAADKGYDGLSLVKVGAIPDKYIEPSGTKPITSNGTYDIAEYENVNVKVPETVEVIPEGYIKPTGTIDIAEKDNNKTVDVSQYASAKVNVPIPSGYIKPSGTKPITTNGTHDVTQYASVAVNVPAGSGEAPNLGGITVTPTKDYQNILATDEGLDGFDEVIVEPIPDEYVKPSGTLDITENCIRSLKKDDGGYYDSVNVNVPSVEPTLIPLSITENDTYNANDYNADGFSSVTVNVESSGGGGSLEAPTISLDGTVLTITDTNGDAVTHYEIYVDDVLLTTVAKAESIDLKTLDIFEGSYVISIKAKRESEESNSVTYASTNVDIRGTWIFNNNLSDIPPANIDIDFIYINPWSKKEEVCHKIYLESNAVAYELKTGVRVSVYNGSWSHEGYRTITINDYTEHSRVDFPAWLVANAVKDTTTDTQALNIITEGE